MDGHDPAEAGWPSIQFPVIKPNKRRNAVMKRINLSVIAVIWVCLTLSLHAQVPQMINYQGRVSVAGTNFDGTGQFKFALVNGTGTTNYWSSGAVSLTVTKGLYSVLLGDTTVTNMTAIPTTVFTNSDVRLRVWFNDGVSGFQQLSPDQRIAAVGYAMIAANVTDGAITSDKLADNAVSSNKLAASAVTAAAIATGAVGTTALAPGAVDSASIANGTILTNNLAPGVLMGTFWRLGGNTGTDPATNNFLGTTDNHRLELRVNNVTVVRLDPGDNVTLGSNNSIPTPPTTDHSAIGGGEYNSIGNGANNSTIGGGYGNTVAASSAYSTIGGGYTNTASGNYGTTVGGGGRNTASAYMATVSGGYRNTASGHTATVGGGTNNTANGSSSTVGGGYQNTAGGYISTVGGGMFNIASNDWATVGGGYQNIAGGGSSTVAGGYNNTASGSSSTVGGGSGNTASGDWATVVGGFYNRASGDYSLAAGNSAVASADGSMVFADSQVGDFVSTVMNEFAIRAFNGVRVQTDVGIHLNYADRPMIVRDWDTFSSSAPDGKANIGRWGLFMEPGCLTMGIPDAGVGYRRMEVALYSTNGTRDTVFSVDNNGMTTVRVITITGGSDLAEPFAMGDGQIPKGSVVVIDEENPGKLKLSDRPYDQRVAGIVSGANGINPGIALHQEGALEGTQNVALTGRVYVLADAASSPIRPGDLLTTSVTPGHAMKASDHAKAQGAIIGKAMTSLKTGHGLVLVLVSLQ
jgi:hypothetical protein